MNSKIYRCGWCGRPTDQNGRNLCGNAFNRIITIIQKYGDSHTEKTTGECCIPEHNLRSRPTPEKQIEA